MSNTPFKQESCGLFGKVPQQSDFVSHHLPSAFTEQWHHWLQSCLSISREQLGDEWLNHYMVSPIWHFALMPGVAHEKSVVGTMIPNVDEVGRYFPSCIAHIGEHNIWSAYLHGHAWFESVENVLLSSLVDETRYSELIGNLESLPVPEFSAIVQYQTQSPMNAFKGNLIVSQQDTQNHKELALSLLHNVFQQRFGCYGLWWTGGSEKVSPSFGMSANLPDPGQYAAMLDGEWQHWGWTEEVAVEISSEEHGVPA